MKIDGNKAYIGNITAYPWSEYEEFETDTSANQMLNFLNSQRDVELYINSGGGDVFEAMQIYNALRRHAQNHSVKVYVDGLSASAASYMMFGGTELLVPTNATIMMHKPSTFAWGNADELQSAVDALNAVQQGIESIYVANAKNLSATQIRHLVDATTWMNGQDFADKFKCTLITELGEDKTTNNKVLTNFQNRMKQADEQRKNIADYLEKRRNEAENAKNSAENTPNDKQTIVGLNFGRKIKF